MVLVAGKNPFPKRKKCPKCQKISMKPVYWAGPSRIPGVIIRYECEICGYKLVPQYTTKKKGSAFITTVKFIEELQYLTQVYAEEVSGRT